MLTKGGAGAGSLPRVLSSGFMAHRLRPGPLRSWNEGFVGVCFHSTCVCASGAENKSFALSEPSEPDETLI